MCTGLRFSDDKGNMYFGRNLDWSTGYGQYVVVTPKGYKYNSAFLGEQEMKYAVIAVREWKSAVAGFEEAVAKSLDMLFELSKALGISLSEIFTHAKL